jgi:hypothetical protein
MLRHSRLLLACYCVALTVSGCGGDSAMPSADAYAPAVKTATREKSAGLFETPVQQPAETTVEPSSDRSMQPPVEATIDQPSETSVEHASETPVEYSVESPPEQPQATADATPDPS